MGGGCDGNGGGDGNCFFVVWFVNLVVPAEVTL